VSTIHSNVLERLTAKEREVLDRVLHHQTTKEIARELDVAPNTVDMRLRSAREKLGARDRNQLARSYAALLSTCGKTTCGPPVMSSTIPGPLPATSETPPSRLVLHDAAAFAPAPWLTEARAELPEVLDQRFGRWWRVFAIPAGALCIALLALALMAISQTLGMLI
jgi:DNA-binding CsgD family transcriptional regulator